MSYVARWEKLKADFQTSTGKSRPKETAQKAILGTVQKASGITPILKDVDSAIQKQQRTPLEQALNKLFVTRGTYVTFLNEEQKKFLHDPNDPDLIVWQAYHALIFGLQKIESDAAEEAKKLQVAKGKGKVAITWLSLEGDIKGTVVAAKKDLASLATLEKKHSVLKKADAAIKEAEKYTKAAAKTDYKPASDALTLFKASAKKGSDDLAKVLAAEKSSADFTKAVQKFHDALKALSSAARIDAQIKNLADAQQAAAD